MKKINENTKVTLTFKQLKALVKEGMAPQVDAEPVKEDFDENSPKYKKFCELFDSAIKEELGNKYARLVNVDLEDGSDFDEMWGDVISIYVDDKDAWAMDEIEDFIEPCLDKAGIDYVDISRDGGRNVRDVVLFYRDEDY